MTGRRTRTVAVVSAIGILFAATAASGSSRDFNAGAVYTLTNAAAGNAVVVFGRGDGGTLQEQGSYPTGGAGSGQGLGSQGALILAGGNTLYAVNAGDNTISQFHVDGNKGLQLVGQPVPSGGVDPISLTASGKYLYVLNAGGSTPNVAGFTTDGNRIAPIAGATRALGPAASSPEQIGLSPDGHTLLVSEKASNTIDTFQVGPNGALSLGADAASIGGGPYGFAFDNHQDLVISEAGSASVSSYSLAGGGLFPISSSVSTNGQNAPCWLVTTNDGKYAFTANAASNSISAFSTTADHAANGTLALIGSTNLGSSASHPLDEGLTNDGHALYVLDTGTAGRQISELSVGQGASLSVLGAAGSLPASASGLAVR